eukprot:Gb_01957 [translate_table: standard]
MPSLLLVFGLPRIPQYSVESIEIKSSNSSKDLGRLSSELDLTIRVQNPNKRIGIYYEENSRLEVFYWENNTELCSGSIPAFYQGHNNTTVVQARLTRPNVGLWNGIGRSLQQNERIPLNVKVNVPFKMKVGSLISPKFTASVRCNLSLEALSANGTARTGSTRCMLDQGQMPKFSHDFIENDLSQMAFVMFCYLGEV